MNAKELEELVNTMRKLGVSYIKDKDVELTLSDVPNISGNTKPKQLSEIELKALEIKEKEIRKEEEMAAMYWSAEV